MNWRLVLSFLLVVLIGLSAVTFVVLAREGRNELTVSFLDVGQGDAILIESPTGIEVLIDAGRDRSVLRELPKVMGPFDRSIDVVMVSHPDADHIGGMAYIFDRYRVKKYLSPAIERDTPVAQALGDALQEEPGLEVLVAERGQRVMLGGGAYLDVLFPDRSVSAVEPNTGSVVVRLVYGETSFLLSGDAPSGVEDWLVALDRQNPEPELDSDVLKAGHHGSNTSTSAKWLGEVTPEIVVVSAGKENGYGHPHDEVVERVSRAGALLFQTAEEGTIRLVSDGKEVRKK